MELYREQHDRISLAVPGVGEFLRTPPFNIRCFTDIACQIFYSGTPNGQLNFESRIYETEQAWVDIGPQYSVAITGPGTHVFEYPDMLGAEVCINFVPNSGCDGWLEAHWLAKRR